MAAFNFEHGDILGHIGATWYVSYAYHQYIDQKHNNYMRVDTWPTRASAYKRNIELERYFIERIAEMSPRRLSKNDIGLTGEDVLQKAREVLIRLK